MQTGTETRFRNYVLDDFKRGDRAFIGWSFRVGVGPNWGGKNVNRRLFDC